MDFDKLIRDLKEAKTPKEYVTAASQLGELGNPAALSALRNALSVVESEIDRCLNTTDSSETSAALLSAFLQTSEGLYGESELMRTLMRTPRQPVRISDYFTARDALKAAIGLLEPKTIRGRIMADVRPAQLDAARKFTLDKVRQSVWSREHELSHKLDDDEMLRLLKTEVQQRRFAIERHQKSGHHDAADKEQAEIAIIETYLPQSASQAEIDQAVTAAIAETGASSMKDLGAVMKAAMAKLAGKSADGKMVSETVKAKLAVSA